MQRVEDKLGVLRGPQQAEGQDQLGTVEPQLGPHLGTVDAAEIRDPVRDHGDPIAGGPVPLEQDGPAAFADRDKPGRAGSDLAKDPGGLVGRDLDPLGGHRMIGVR